MNPVYSQDNELAIIGCICMSNNLYYNEQITSEMFYDTICKQLFQTLEKMFDKGLPVDPVSLSTVYSKYHPTEEVKPLIAKSVEICGPYNYQEYCRSLKTDYNIRELQKLSSEIPEIIQDHLDNPSEAVAEIDSRVFNIGVTDVKPYEQVKSIVDKTLQFMDNKNSIRGISTGYTDLDKLIGGFKPGLLYVVAGRPAMGKTALGLNFSRNMALGNHPNGFISLEMSDIELTQRLAAMESGVNLVKVTNCFMDDEEAALFTDACATIKKYPLFIDDNPGQTLSGIKRLTKLMIQKNKIKSIVIDQLSHIVTPREERNNLRTYDIEAITRGLKAMAKQFHIPVILLLQISREATKREDKRPTLSDLKDSGAIEQDADVILLLHREEYYKKNDAAFTDHGIFEVEVGKQRNGPCDTVKLFFSKECQLIKNIQSHGEYHDERD